jgi:hypothetical protein
MATFFFSGIDKPPLVALLAKQQACGMLNANSAAEPALQEAIARHPTVRFILDSGSVQDNRNIQAYARLVMLMEHRVEWAANLDAIDNQDMSDRHFQTLQALLARKEQARAKLLWIYQCQSRGAFWHPDGDLDRLKRAVEQHQFIGLGGLRSVFLRDLFRAQDLLDTIGDILDAAGAQAHVFGLGSYSLLSCCLTQRWFRSADSARWLQGLRSHLLLTVDGTAMSGTSLTFSGLQCAEHNVRAIQAWMQSSGSIPRPASLDTRSRTAHPVQLHWID